MRNVFLAAVAAVLLTACAGLNMNPNTAFTSWASICEGYASTLLVVAPSIADGSMSDSSVETVLLARDTIGPFCLGGVPVTSDAPVTTQVLEVLFRLQGLS